MVLGYNADLRYYRALGAKKRVLLLVCVPALAQHGDQTVHSTHTRLRRCRRPSGGAGAPGGGYDLRWQDMILRDQILEGQN